MIAKRKRLKRGDTIAIAWDGFVYTDARVRDIKGPKAYVSFVLDQASDRPGKHYALWFDSKTLKEEEPLVLRAVEMVRRVRLRAVRKAARKGIQSTPFIL